MNRNVEYFHKKLLLFSINALEKNVWQFAINNNNCQLAGCAVEPPIVTSQYVSLHISKALFQQFLQRESLSRYSFDLRLRAPECTRKWLNHRISNSLAIVSPLSANPPRAAARLPSMTRQFCENNRTTVRNLIVTASGGP